jgi:lipopolysaccharide biosynthesis protein
VGADPAPADEDAVVVHAYYPDLLGEIIEAAGDARDLPWFVTTAPSELLLEQCREILDGAGISHQVRPAVNRGRDIWPFLQLLPELSMLGVTRFIKVHTKRSPHRIDGDRWRRDLLIDTFSLWERDRWDRAEAPGDDRPGMLIPKRHAISLLANMGHNAALLSAVQQRAGTHLGIRGDHQFAGGSMFLGSVDVFAGLAARLAIWPDDFPAERGQIDGTLAHALERSWMLLLEADGCSVVVR